MKLYIYLILLVGLLNITSTQTMDGFSPESKALFMAIEAEQGEGFFAQHPPILQAFIHTPAPARKTQRAPRARKKISFANKVKKDSTKKGTVECPHCPRTFTNRSHCNRHVITAHENSVIFSCPRPSCASSFPRLDTLQEHVRQVHTNKIRHYCPEIGCTRKRNYGCKSSLIKHLRRDHELEMTPGTPEYDRLTRDTYMAIESDESTTGSPSSLDLEYDR